METREELWYRSRKLEQGDLFESIGAFLQSWPRNWCNNSRLIFSFLSSWCCTAEFSCIDSTKLGRIASWKIKRERDCRTLKKFIVLAACHCFIYWSSCTSPSWNSFRYHWGHMECSWGNCSMTVGKVLCGHCSMPRVDICEEQTLSQHLMFFNCRLRHEHDDFLFRTEKVGSVHSQNLVLGRNWCSNRVMFTSLSLKGRESSPKQWTDCIHTTSNIMVMTKDRINHENMTVRLSPFHLFTNYIWSIVSGCSTDYHSSSCLRTVL